MDEKVLGVSAAIALSESCRDTGIYITNQFKVAAKKCHYQRRKILAKLPPETTVSGCVEAFVLRKICMSLLELEWKNIQSARALAPELQDINDAVAYWDRIDKLITSDYKDCVKCFGERYGVNIEQGEVKDSE